MLFLGYNTRVQIVFTWNAVTVAQVAILPCLRAQSENQSVSAGSIEFTRQVAAALGAIEPNPRHLKSRFARVSD